MKKRSSTSFVVWVIVGIWLHAHVSIGAMSSSKSNDTTSVCDGSVEDCLIVHHNLDSQLPTISSDRVSRMLADGSKYAPTLKTGNKHGTPFCSTKNGYKDCSAIADGKIHCQEVTNRACHYNDKWSPRSIYSCVVMLLLLPFTVVFLLCIDCWACFRYFKNNSISSTGGISGKRLWTYICWIMYAFLLFNLLDSCWILTSKFYPSISWLQGRISKWIHKRGWSLIIF